MRSSRWSFLSDDRISGHLLSSFIELSLSPSLNVVNPVIFIIIRFCEPSSWTCFPDSLRRSQPVFPSRPSLPWRRRCPRGSTIITCPHSLRYPLDTPITTKDLLKSRSKIYTKYRIDNWVNGRVKITQPLNRTPDNFRNITLLTTDWHDESVDEEGKPTDDKGSRDDDESLRCLSFSLWLDGLPMGDHLIYLDPGGGWRWLKLWHHDHLTRLLRFVWGGWLLLRSKGHCRCFCGGALIRCWVIWSRTFVVHCIWIVVLWSTWWRRLTLFSMTNFWLTMFLILLIWLVSCYLNLDNLCCRWSCRSRSPSIVHGGWWFRCVVGNEDIGCLGDSGGWKLCCPLTCWSPCQPLSRLVTNSFSSDLWEFQIDRYTKKDSRYNRITWQSPRGNSLSIFKLIPIHD